MKKITRDGHTSKNSEEWFRGILKIYYTLCSFGNFFFFFLSSIFSFLKTDATCTSKAKILNKRYVFFGLITADQGKILINTFFQGLMGKFR